MWQSLKRIEYYSFERITELDTLYAKFMLQAGLVRASQRHQIFMYLRSVNNILPPPAEAKHYTACELRMCLNYATKEY